MLDTGVIVAAFRSDRGASRQLLLAALDRRFTLLVSVALMLEYEAVLTRPEHLAAAGVAAEDADAVLDALAAVSTPMEAAWRGHEQSGPPLPPIEARPQATSGSDPAKTGEPLRPAFLWRPRLRDPADEMVLEAAVNGGAECLVTFNTRHLAQAALEFGIPAVLPRDAWRTLEERG